MFNTYIFNIYNKIKTKIKLIVTKNIEYVNKKGDHIIINIEDLSYGSNRLIISKCDYCGTEKEISYKEYIKNIKYNGKFSCSYNCGALKRKELCLVKNGVESPFQLDDIKNKIKNYYIDNFGVENISQIDEIKDIKHKKWEENKETIIGKISNTWKNKDNISEINEKRKKTNYDKYGVFYISSLDSVKDKKKNTFKDKWGGFPYESKIISEKITNTVKDKYDVYNYSETIEYIQKVKQTCLEKYKTEYYFCSDDFKNKSTKTLKDKYGVENIMHNLDFKKSQSNKSILKFNKKYNINILEYNNNILKIKCDKCGEIYEIPYIFMKNRHKHNVQKCIICNPINNNVSGKELELYDFIKQNYSKKILLNDRTILNGKELDIYLPDIKLAFEFNGLFWHSNLYKDKNYHLDKSNMCDEKGITLIHVYEDDWIYKKDIIKSLIMNNLVDYTPVDNNTYNIKEIIDKDIIKTFFGENHINGYIESQISLGLYNDNILISMISFNYNKPKTKYELIQFCDKLNHNTYDNTIKLFNYFLNIYLPKHIFTYVDRSYFNGKILYKIGFEKTDISKPKYYYIVENMRTNKIKYSKNIKNVKKYDKTPLKIYDSGWIKYEIIF